MCVAVRLVVVFDTVSGGGVSEAPDGVTTPAGVFTFAPDGVTAGQVCLTG